MKIYLHKLYIEPYVFFYLFLVENRFASMRHKFIRIDMQNHFSFSFLFFE